MQQTTDPGFFTLELEGQTRKLDTFAEQDVIFKLNEKHPDDKAAMHQAMAGHLAKTFGLEAVSTAYATMYIQFVLDRVDDVKKKLAELPGWPSITPDSTHTASNPGSSPDSTPTSAA